MTACACDRSPTSAPTTASSVLPDENAVAASTALEVWTTFNRTLAFVAASRDAMAETIRPASPSSEPTATLSVVGREYQWHARRPIAVTRTSAPATMAIRTHL